MHSSDLLADAFDRIRQAVRQAVQDLTPQQLAVRLDDDANSIAWLVWHLTRVQDDHVADVAGTEQVWLTGGWHERFALPFEPGAHGYGHTSAQVAAVQVPGDLLIDYHEAVCAQTLAYVRDVTDDDLARVVDESWDPPVTLAVRLVSVLSDDLQHVGQAAFIRGVIERR